MKYFKLIVNLLLYHHRTTLYTCFFRSTPKTLKTLYLTSVNWDPLRLSQKNQFKLEPIDLASIQVYYIIINNFSSVFFSQKFGPTTFLSFWEIFTFFLRNFRISYFTKIYLSRKRAWNVISRKKRTFSQNAKFSAINNLLLQNDLPSLLETLAHANSICIKFT